MALAPASVVGKSALNAAWPKHADAAALRPTGPHRVHTPGWVSRVTPSVHVRSRTSAVASEAVVADANADGARGAVWAIVGGSACGTSRAGPPGRAGAGGCARRTGRSGCEVARARRAHGAACRSLVRAVRAGCRHRTQCDITARSLSRGLSSLRLLQPLHRPMHGPPLGPLKPGMHTQDASWVEPSARVVELVGHCVQASFPVVDLYFPT